MSGRLGRLGNPFKGTFTRQFLAIFLPLAMLVAASADLIGRAQSEGEIQRLRAAESTRVGLGAGEILRGLQKVPAHLRSLQIETAIRRAIDAQTPEAIEGMAASLTTLLQRNPEYDQARWIDETGMERVRVNRSSDASGVRVVPADELQDKSDRYFFRESVDLPLDRVYVSKLDLNVDNDQITIPYAPTIRFCIPIADSSGHRRGIMAVNYLASSLLARFIDVTDRSDRHISLVNRDGYWLSSPDPQDEWGFMFNRPITMQGRHPEAWMRIVGRPFGQTIDVDGLWTWQDIVLQGVLPGLQINLDGPTWIVVSHRPEAVLGAIYRRIWIPVGGISLALVAVLAAMSWHLAARTRRERQALESRVRAETAAAESAKRLAEVELAHVARAKLASIVESSQDAIISKNLDSVVTSWNTGAEKLFGYTVEEAVGRNISMLIPAERLHEEQEIIARIGKGETIGHFETVRRHKDGHLVDIAVTISPIRDPLGNIIGASKIARDITEAKRQEAELQRHREHLELLVEQRTAEIAEAAERLKERDNLITAVTDNIPGVVSYWDHELLCRFANKGFVEWFGKRPDEIIGRTMEEAIGRAAMESGLQIRKAVLRGEAKHTTREVQKPDGTTGSLSLHYIPDFWGTKVVGYFVLAIDITRQKEAEDRLRLLNSKLTDALASAQEANHAKGQFLANMSHEIRTPMNGVIGMLELLGHTQLDTEQSRMIHTINGSAQSLLQIINDILDFSKIEAGQLKIEAVEVNVTEIVETTAKLFLGAATAKGISIRCFVSPTIRYPLLTDPVRLRQILSNLVSNAIKFSLQGSVTIIADTDIDEAGSTLLRLKVSDTGVGISPEAQARLFQPFTQADDSIARKFGGTGLGLSICRRLSDLMGGAISLSSAEGKGTEVSLTLPARWSREAQDVRDFTLAGLKVGLFIDDPTERHYLGEYLSYWGATLSELPRDAAKVREWLTDSLAIVVTPARAASEARALLEAARKGLSSRLPHYVQYCNDDLPEDRSPANDSILTTALSRARFLGAVAVAAARKSPEIEMMRHLPQPQAKAKVASRDQAIRDGMLILLAEDHPVNREVVLRQLRFLGYTADAVEDGAQALAALARTRYALLLTDCNMPVMDGFALVASIRQMENAGDHLPIIALTANALEGEDRRCLDAGMDDYLSKPVDLNTLRGRLERWLAPLKPGDVQSAEAAQRREEPAEGATIDLSVLAEICGDDPAAIHETLRLYIDSLKADFEALSKAVSERDPDAAALYAHRIKGAARAVGGRVLEKCAEAAEREAVARDWAGLEAELSLIRNAVADIDLASGPQTRPGGGLMAQSTPASPQSALEFADPEVRRRL